MQEWTQVLEDISFLRAHNPTDMQVLLLRARVYCCIRKWDLALLDYSRVLVHDPNNETAIESKKIILEVHDILPMIDMSIVDNENPVR